MSEYVEIFLVKRRFYNTFLQTWLVVSVGDLILCRLNRQQLDFEFFCDSDLLEFVKFDCEKMLV